jgi:hypothetical protein
LSAEQTTTKDYENERHIRWESRGFSSIMMIFFIGMDRWNRMVWSIKGSVSGEQRPLSGGYFQGWSFTHPPRKKAEKGG